MKKNSNRRNFLKSITLTAAVASAAATAPGQQSSSKFKIPRRKLGETGARTSILGIGLGSMYWKPFGDKPDEAAQIALKALDYGVNYWDTARSYSNSELLVGPAVEQVRDKIFLVSKSGTRDYDGFMRDLETSLKNLRTDHLDLYHLHNIDPDKDTDLDAIENGAVRAARKAKDQGMIRNFGITGHVEAGILMECMRRWSPDVVMTTFPADRPDNGRFEDELVPLAQSMKIGVNAMKAVRYAINTDWPPSRLVRYTMSVPGITTTVIGLDSFVHLEENATTASNFIPMGKDEMASFSRTVKSELATMGHAPWLHPLYSDGVTGSHLA